MAGHTRDKILLDEQEPSWKLVLAIPLLSRGQIWGDIEVGTAWNKKGQASGNDYVSVSLAAPEFGDRTIYANLGRAAGSENENEFALIWNPNS